MRIGVLAAQGAFVEHIDRLRHLGVEAFPVRLLQELKGIDGLIIPGGESTTISRLMVEYNLTSEIKKLAEQGLPIFGTCAGMILLASEITDGNNITGKPGTSLDLMDIRVKRNAFGRQRESFETELTIPVLGKKTFPGIFIRAPLIEQVKSGEILARLDNGTIVAAHQGRLLVSAFHPELTDDHRFHHYFLDIAGGHN